MLNETSMLYKLTVLYILSKVQFPISNNQISNFILENDFTDYFNIQQIMSELIEDGYVTEDTVRNRTFYRLSDDGAAALKLLIRELSPSIRHDVEEYIKKNKMNLRDEISVMADYYQVDINHYVAHLFVDEDAFRLLEINVATTTEEEADKICANWRNSSSELYPIILEKLLFKKNEN